MKSSYELFNLLPKSSYWTIWENEDIFPWILELQQWLTDNLYAWAQNRDAIIGNNNEENSYFAIQYDATKSLLEQSDETKQDIINLIKKYGTSN